MMTLSGSMLFSCKCLLGGAPRWCMPPSTRQFCKRGFLNGRSARSMATACLLVVAFWRRSRQLFVLFVGAALLTSGLELLTGFLTDKLLIAPVGLFPRFP